MERAFDKIWYNGIVCKMMEADYYLYMQSKQKLPCQQKKSELRITQTNAHHLIL